MTMKSNLSKRIFCLLDDRLGPLVFHVSDGDLNLAQFVGWQDALKPLEVHL
jgi:hypothetical protein